MPGKRREGLKLSRICVCHKVVSKENGVLLPTRSEERGVLGVGGIPVAILPSCQYSKTVR